MRVHFDVLGWLHVLAGWMGMLAGAAFLLLAAGSTTLDIEPAVAARVSAVFWLLLVGGLLTVAAGALTAAVGRGLLGRHRGARFGALLLAVPGLCVLPFGTALSVYTVWALLNDDARGAFGRRLRGSGTQ
jgi:hypothetical protein